MYTRISIYMYINLHVYQDFKKPILMPITDNPLYTNLQIYMYSYLRVDL